MGQVPLHPALVHIPLGLAFVLPLVALGIAVALWRGWIAPRAFALLVLLQALVVGGGLLALRTGEADEDRVEDTAGERAVEAHEEAAHRFMFGAGFSLALGIVGLLLTRRQAALRWTAAGMVAATLVEAGLAARTGQRGGELVYGAGAAQADGVRPGRGQDDDD